MDAAAHRSAAAETSQRQRGRRANVLHRTGHFAYTVFSTEDMKILQERIAWAGNWTETNVIASWHDSGSTATADRGGWW